MLADDKQPAPPPPPPPKDPPPPDDDGPLEPVRIRSSRRARPLHQRSL